MFNKILSRTVLNKPRDNYNKKQTILLNRLRKCHGQEATDGRTIQKYREKSPAKTQMVSIRLKMELTLFYLFYIFSL